MGWDSHILSHYSPAPVISGPGTRQLRTPHAPESAKIIPISQLCGEGNGTPLQYFCLENPMDGGAWWAVVREVAKGRTRLSNFTFTFHFRALEKEMATHSSVLAWRIPGTGEPGGLPSIGSQSRTRLTRLSSSRSKEALSWE